MNKIIIYLLMSCISTTFASSPSVEGLFRNPSNGDVTTNTILLNFSINREGTVENVAGLNSEDEGQLNQYFVKFIFDMSLKGRVRLLKVIYSNAQMKSEDIINLKYSESLLNENFEKDQQFFNALMSSLVLNRSKEIMTYLKNISKDIKNNKEVLDKEKLGLLSRYKNYLKVKEESPETANPLSPSSIDEKKRVQDILKKPLLVSGDEIKLVRKGEHFEWNLTLDAVQGVFENESLKMKRLEVQNVSSQDQVLLDNFLLVDGVHEFPKYFKINLNGESFNISLMKMLHFDSKKTSIRERLKNYNKKIRKMNIVTKPVLFPLI